MPTVCEELCEQFCVNKIISAIWCHHAMLSGSLGQTAVQREHNQRMAPGLVFISWVDDFNVSQHEILTSDFIS